MSGTGGGKIITFYSYKGGTGRSMLLANVAWILAANGARVLVVDWDLEAPGLHRYFAPFLRDKTGAATDGVIDMVAAYAVGAVTPKPSDDPLWYLRLANIRCYASSLDPGVAGPFPGRGLLDFVSAGRQSAAYASRVNAFDWQNFYTRLRGGTFLERVRDSMRESYDFVLIDSRTGVSDTAGVCTVQFPDQLVVCFTFNNQSIDGAAAVAESAMEQRRDGSLAVFPVPCRAENAERDKLDYARDTARRRFKGLIPASAASALAEYWGDVEVPYVPYYAYEEILAVFGDRPGVSTSIVTPATRLASHLTAGQYSRLPEIPDGTRKSVLAQFERGPISQGNNDFEFDVYLSAARTELEFAANLKRELEGRRLKVFFEPGAASGNVSDPIMRSQHTVGVIGPTVDRRQFAELATFVSGSLVTSGVDRKIVPVLTLNARLDGLPDLLRQFRPIFEQNGNVVTVANEVVRALERPAPSTNTPSVRRDKDDSQKGKWGGRPDRNARIMEATVRAVEDPDWFSIRLTVRSTDPARPLAGTVQFYLHESFPEPKRKARVRNGVAVLNLEAYGAFTVGAAADDGETTLELDLATLADAPEIFRLA